MPLDDFQKAVTAVVSRNRGDGSPFAGGAVIQQHGFRLSDDQDIFTDDGDRLDGLVAADRTALEAEGYTVRETRSYSGFRECAVMKPMVGTTVLQWTAALGREFYAPVPDPLFGRRLHFADLAANKALAAAGRMKKRDFVDLWMLDRHVMPLWRIACAAPGKDAGLNPFSLIEDAALNWSAAMRNDGPAGRPKLTTDISLAEVGAGLRRAMREARLILPELGPECYGRLQVDDSGQPLRGREPAAGGAWKPPMPGGALPAFAGMDSEMIAGLIAEHGLEGSRHTGLAAEADMDKPDPDRGPDFSM